MSTFGRKVGDPLTDDALSEVTKVCSLSPHLGGYWEMRSERLGYDIGQRYDSAINSIAISSQALYYFLNNFEDENSFSGIQFETPKYFFYIYGACNAAYVQQDGLKYLYNLSTDNKMAYKILDDSAWSKIRDLRAAGFAHPTNYKSDGERSFVTMMYFGGVTMSAESLSHGRIEKIPVGQPIDFLELFTKFRQESIICLQQCATEMEKLKDVAIRKVKEAWDEYYS